MKATASRPGRRRKREPAPKLSRAFLGRFAPTGRSMARLGPCFLPDQPLHVTQRGNIPGAIFFGDDDYARIATGSARRRDTTAAVSMPMSR